MCRNKGAGPLYLSWQDGMELGTRWTKPNSQSDISPGRLLVWISWPRGSNSRINWFLKAAPFSVVVPSSRTAPLLQQWFPRGQMMERVNKMGWMEPFDSITPWFVQLGWRWQKHSPGTWSSCLRSGRDDGAAMGSSSCSSRDVKPKGRLGLSAALSALQGETSCLQASLQQNKPPCPEAGPQQDPLPVPSGFWGQWGLIPEN